LLVALARFVCDRALPLVGLALLLAAGSVAFTFWKLEFITDRNALVAPDAEYNRRFLRFLESFGDQELMLLMVAPGDGPVDNPGYNPSIPDADTRAEMKQAAARVASELRRRPEYFPEVIDRVDPDSFSGTRMLYLPAQDLDAVAAQVKTGAPLIERLANEPSYPSLLLGLREGIEQGVPQDADLQQAGAEMAALLRAIHDDLAAAPGTPSRADMFRFESSDPAVDPDGYFFLWEGRVLFIAILPTKDPGALNQVQEPLAHAREVVRQVQDDHPGLSLGLTGRPVIYSDEMAASGRDMTFATIFAVFAVGLMFVLAFRSFARPLLAVLSLVLALCWTIGATTLLIGHLNIFAMVFGVVLVGLGIDFGIHLLAHYRHGLERGLGVRDTLVEVYSEIGMGTVLGAVTTAAALSTAAFTDFLGLAELGLICGIGIIFCLFAMLVVFPAMLVVVDQRRVGDGNPALRDSMAEREGRELADRRPARSRFSRAGAATVALLVAASLVVTGVEVSKGWIPFDYNLLELNDPASPGVHWEKLLIDHDQRASYAVSTSRDLEELRRLRREYERQGDIIADSESILPRGEEAKRRTLAEVHATLPASFSDPGEPATPAQLRTAARRLQAALVQLQTRGPSYEAAFAPALEQVQGIRELAGNEQRLQARLDELEPAFFAGLVKALRDLKRDADPPPVTAETLPPILRTRYVGAGPDGETLYALYVYPRKNAWVRENAGEFNETVLAIDPDATGVTIQIHESGSLIVQGFGRSVAYAFLAICLLLLIDLRRPLAVLIALMPVLTSLAILLGVMTVTDLSFNFANFFGVPILIGTMIDAGVYLVHSQRHGDTRRTLRQTRRACLLCGMTTLLGFGSLITASHLGIVSLGMVLIVGCLAGVMGSYFIVPVTLAWFNERGRRV
jgi:uncharacterized protein